MCNIFWFWDLFGRNAQHFRENYLSSDLLEDKIFFLNSLWTSAMGAFRVFLCLILLEIGEEAVRRGSSNSS